MKATPLSLASFDLDILKGWDIRLSPRFWSYRPLFKIHLESSQYILKTATSMDELISVFSLRHSIFLEHTEGGGHADGYDLDQFDDQCDHLIIIDKQTDEICGTYRVLTSLTADNFYSETEFKMKKFLATPGVKMELGRACIHHNHRNGSVIDLLWRGIGMYVQKSGAEYLFGCSSVKSTDINTAFALFQELSQSELLSDEYEIRSYGNFEVDFSDLRPALLEVDSKRLLPPLLRSYFSAGAKVYGTPALDIEFECFDFLTILKLTELSASFKRRYFS